MKKLTLISNLFKALSDENRLNIIQMVYKGDLKCALNKKGECKDRTCVKNLREHLKIGLPTVSHHVKELTRAGLIKTKKEGRWSYLQINPKYFRALTDFLKAFINTK